MDFYNVGLVNVFVSVAAIELNLEFYRPRSWEKMYLVVSVCPSVTTLPAEPLDL